MKENVWKRQQYKLGLLTERSVSLQEVKEIHQNLLNQLASISEEVAEAIERNDYVRLSHLLANRSKIQSAINEIESLYEDELISHISITDRISKALKDTATTMEDEGEDILSKLTNNLDRLNESAGDVVTKAIVISIKTLSKGNQLNHRVGKLIIHKTSDGLAKLADIIQKRF
ncbi:hypothetical protein [Pseudalkalibacillus caeni]|uniref:Uncharacterized protein n=1 Tax=Exobacillus caeni TaxID=2574798 RepID=A0A5R9EWI5_9BACL|nr:hypothetical protein [Pseudalkalibacillus caeni]TLS35407.1 hypothetical protein FCL54_20645 [Pseudalkalibacillus caeni]